MRSAKSDVNAVGSEGLVSLGFVPIKTPVRIDSVGIVHGDTGSRNSGDLDVVKRLLVTVEHDSHAGLDESASLGLSHICSPAIGHKNLAVMGGQASEEEVGLDLRSVEIGHAEEMLTSLLADTSDNGGAPKRVHLQSAAVVVLSDEVVVITR